MKMIKGKLMKVSLLWSACIVMLVVAGLGVTLIHNGFSARDTPSALETYVARTTRKLAVPSSARSQKNPFAVTPEVLAEARSHFADHCAICHGNDGSGKTEIGQNLYPKAPDMRLPVTQNLSDGEMYYIIHNGIRLTGMPAWGTSAKDDDSWKLVLFIRHLPQLTAEEEEEMKKLNPKSGEEWKEEQEEEKFLNEGQARNSGRSTNSPQSLRR
jgi:mono/diheme cytochrome c family protein